MVRIGKLSEKDKAAMIVVPAPHSEEAIKEPQSLPA